MSFFLSKGTTPWSSTALIQGGVGVGDTATGTTSGVLDFSELLLDAPSMVCRGNSAPLTDGSTPSRPQIGVYGGGLGNTDTGGTGQPFAWLDARPPGTARDSSSGLQLPNDIHIDQQQQPDMMSAFLFPPGLSSAAEACGGDSSRPAAPPMQGFDASFFFAADSGAAAAVMDDRPANAALPAVAERGADASDATLEGQISKNAPPPTYGEKAEHSDDQFHSISNDTSGIGPCLPEATAPKSLSEPPSSGQTNETTEATHTAVTPLHSTPSSAPVDLTCVAAASAASGVSLPAFSPSAPSSTAANFASSAAAKPLAVSFRALMEEAKRVCDAAGTVHLPSEAAPPDKNSSTTSLVEPDMLPSHDRVGPAAMSDAAFLSEAVQLQQQAKRVSAAAAAMTASLQSRVTDAFSAVGPNAAVGRLVGEAYGSTPVAHLAPLLVRLVEDLLQGDSDRSGSTTGAGEGVSAHAAAPARGERESGGESVLPASVR